VTKKDAFMNKKGHGKYTDANPGLRSVKWTETHAGTGATHDILKNVEKNQLGDGRADGGKPGPIKFGVD
jgi:hypothetical protein